jgi:hypothetical protein
MYLFLFCNELGSEGEERMLKAIFEILLIIVAIVIFCAAGSNTEKVQYGKDKKKSTH